MKIWSKSIYVLGIIPLSFTSSLLLFYINASIILGKFPVYGQPDPKTLDIYYFYAPVISVTTVVWVFSIPIWLILILIYVIKKRKEIEWRPIVVSSLSHVSACMILFSHITEWFAD